MSEVSRIIDQLQRAYQGPAWHGPALSQVLAGVSAETAAARPLPQAHTIWEIVAHVTVWVAVVTRRLKGEQIPTLPPERDWPEVSASDGVAWRDTLDQLAGAQRDLVGEARKIPDSRLSDQILGDIPYSIYTMLHGVVQHNLYHAGQIALLKRISQQ